MVSVASQVRLRSESRFYAWMAFAMAAVTLIGFAPTYYFVGIHDGPTPVLTPRLHVHGVLSTAWIVLLIAQTQLIAAGQRRLHRLFGFSGLALAATILVTGIVVALASERRVHTAANAGTLADPYVFLMFPLANVCLFAGFVVLGVLYRHRADSHKRLMLLATMNLIGPALARIVTQIVSGVGIAGVPGVTGALVLVNVFIGALAIHDYATRGRLHPVTLWGGGFIILSEPLRFAVARSSPWQAFAQMLMG
jgi:hypothetical protein